MHLKLRASPTTSRMVFLTPLLFFFDLTDILIFQSANLQTSNNGRAPEETSDPDVHSHEQGQHHLWQNQALLRVCTWYSITGHWFDSKSKHHHVRFFPQENGGDKNSNALPGTLVESGVTQPYENDFYLCAHAAIKGTARPVHYNVNGVTQPYENGFYWCACLATTQDLEVGQTPSFTSLLLGLRLRRWISSHRSIVHRDSCGLRMEEVEKQDQPYLWQTLPMEFSIILF